MVFGDLVRDRRVRHLCVHVWLSQTLYGGAIRERAFCRRVQDMARAVTGAGLYDIEICRHQSHCRNDTRKTGRAVGGFGGLRAVSSGIVWLGAAAVERRVFVPEWTATGHGLRLGAGVPGG